MGLQAGIASWDCKLCWPLQAATYPLPQPHRPQATIFSTISVAKKVAKDTSVRSSRARRLDPAWTPWLSIASRVQLTCSSIGMAPAQTREHKNRIHMYYMQQLEVHDCGYSISKCAHSKLHQQCRVGSCFEDASRGK